METSLDTQTPLLLPGHTSQGFPSCHPGVASPIIFWDSSNTLSFTPAGASYTRLRLSSRRGVAGQSSAAGHCLCGNILTAELTTARGRRCLEAGDCWPGPSAFFPPFIIPHSHPNQCDAARRSLCHSFWLCSMFGGLAHFPAEKCPQIYGLTYTSFYGGS